jgi:hypothetical protein
VPQGWDSIPLEMKGIPQIEQKGGSIQWISERQFTQNPCCPSPKNLSQQGHCGGRKNWKRVDRNFMVHASLGVCLKEVGQIGRLK